MAKKYYGLNVGQGIQDIVVSSSTNNTDVEVVVDTTDVQTELEIKKGLDNIMGYIQQTRYNPA